MTFDELSARYRQLASELEQLSAEAARAAQERDRVSQERDRASHERDEYKKLYELVSLELERTRRHLFGKKAETVDPSQTQLAFFLATESEKLPRSSEGGAAGDKQRGERSKPAPHGRSKVPEHLPTERIELVPVRSSESLTRGNASARKRASLSNGGARPMCA